jgi:hypothetical protein
LRRLGSINFAEKVIPKRILAIPKHSEPRHSNAMKPKDPMPTPHGNGEIKERR